MSYGNGSSGYWHGSGTLSDTITVEIVCYEQCYECTEANPCDAVFEEDLQTDDYGNIDCEVTCAKCNHKINVKRERD